MTRRTRRRRSLLPAVTGEASTTRCLVAPAQGAWHAFLKPVGPQEVETKSGKTRRGAGKSLCVLVADPQDSSDDDGDRREAVAAARKPSDKQAQQLKVYDFYDPST